jgi:Pectate lyase superfamily protein
MLFISTFICSLTAAVSSEYSFMKKLLKFFRQRFITFGCAAFLVASLCFGQVPAPINIANYGAVCDGRTNDAPAINKAIRAAKSLHISTVTIPGGVCAIAASSGAAITLDGSVSLEGSGPSQEAMSSLIFKSSGTVAAIAIAGSSQISHGMIRNLNLIAGTTDPHTVGIFLGGDPNNFISPSGDMASFQTLENIYVRGFGTNIQYGNNAYGMTYNNVNLDGALEYNMDTQTVGLSATGITERVVGGLWGAAGIAGLRNYNGNWKFFGTHFEYNCTGILLAYGAVNLYSPHFEQTDESCGPFIHMPGGQAQLYINGGDMTYNSSSSSTTSAEAIKVDYGTANIVIDNVVFETNGSKMTYAVNNSTSNTGLVSVKALATSNVGTILQNPNATIQTLYANPAVSGTLSLPLLKAGYLCIDSFHRVFSSTSTCH